MSWLSKQLEKSKRKRTGIFSWGDSNVANFIDPTGTLDKGLDQLANSTDTKKPTPKEVAGFIPAGFAGYDNQAFLYLIGGLIAYKIIFK